jgi:hypothetical protein
MIIREYARIASWKGGSAYLGKGDVLLLKMRRRYEARRVIVSLDVILAPAVSFICAACVRRHLSMNLTSFGIQNRVA